MLCYTLGNVRGTFGDAVRTSAVSSKGVRSTSGLSPAAQQPHNANPPEANVPADIEPTLTELLTQLLCRTRLPAACASQLVDACDSVEHGHPGACRLLENVLRKNVALSSNVALSAGGGASTLARTPLQRHHASQASTGKPKSGDAVAVIDSLARAAKLPLGHRLRLKSTIASWS